MTVVQENNPIQNTVQEMFNNSYDSVFNQNTFEILGYDGQTLQRGNATSLAIQLDYVSGTNPIYIGIAAPGTATSASYWQIRKLTWDSNNNPTVIQYANGSPNFNQIYDNRASLTYS